MIYELYVTLAAVTFIATLVAFLKRDPLTWGFSALMSLVLTVESFYIEKTLQDGTQIIIRQPELAYLFLGLMFVNLVFMILSVFADSIRAWLKPNEW